MEFIKKHKVILIVAAVIFVIALLFEEKPRNYGFGITYIGKESMAQEDFYMLTSALSEGVRQKNDCENINIEEITMKPDEGTGRQTALSRLWGGDGVIYIADYALVRSIIDDDSLFAPLPDSLEADIFSDSGVPLAKSLESFSGVSLSKDYENLCIFIRSFEAENKGLSEYYENNYDAAVSAISEIK